MEDELLNIFIELKNVKPITSHDLRFNELEKQFFQMKELIDMNSLENCMSITTQRYKKLEDLIEKQNSKIDKFKNNGDQKTEIPCPTFNPGNFPNSNSNFSFNKTTTPSDEMKNEYLIGLRQRTSEVLFLNPRINPDTPEVLKINPECFLDGKPSIQFPPEYSKYVNIGDSILITGGMDKGVSIRECFFIQITKDDGRSGLLISSYPPMKDKRERHNIIFLQDVKSVLVCGGFYTKSSEITNLEERSWNELAPMKEQRANATLLYHNNKTVYCFGGFHVGDKPSTNTSGNYLNTCEFLDVKKPEAVWNFFDLDSIFKSGLRLCAMGVLPVAKNCILLLGGYDGHRYLSCVHEINFDSATSQIIGVKKSMDNHPSIPRGVIFPSSAEFLKFNNIMYNFDFQNKTVQFDIYNRSILTK
jgi:hypothetical protein